MRRYLVAGGCVSGVARLLSAALSLVTWHVTRDTSHVTQDCSPGRHRVTRGQREAQMVQQLCKKKLCFYVVFDNFVKRCLIGERPY